MNRKDLILAMLHKWKKAILVIENTDTEQAH